ncbi:hypothetical protein BC832DRAFT_546797 [Gaertneriomyces semiglobifer]|nr:hypothetical protein BC832DRAFT_546797 [Gaertneriomyces semiglobifer]
MWFSHAGGLALFRLFPSASKAASFVTPPAARGLRLRPDQRNRAGVSGSVGDLLLLSGATGVGLPSDSLDSAGVSNVEPPGGG